MKKSKEKMTWYDVKLYQFNELQNIIKIEDETERVIAMAQLFWGDDVIDLPLKDFNDKVRELEFLNEELPTQVPPKKVEINGNKYFVDCLLGNITTAQYIDFTNHSETGDMSKILSVFIVPEGHKYNDGYDMLKVMDDIKSMPIPIVNNIAFFFERQFYVFMKIFQYYSIKRVKKLKMPKDLKKKTIEMVKHSMDLVLSPLS